MKTKLTEEEREFAELDDEVYDLTVRLRRADLGYNPRDSLERRALIKVLEDKGLIKYIDIMRAMKDLLEGDLRTTREKNTYQNT